MSYKPLVILIVGLFFLLVGGVKLAFTGIFISSAMSAEGTVIELSREVNVAPGGDFDTYLIVEFHTNEGQLVSFKDDGPAVDVGDKVEVLYDPANPSQARVRDFWKLWGWFLLAFSVGYKTSPTGCQFCPLSSLTSMVPPASFSIRIR